jgi:hypothetical protein
MNKIYLLIACCFLSVACYSQTGLMTPGASGGFENGGGFGGNFWTAVNGAANQWATGNAAGAFIGTKGAYIGTATTFTGTAVASINHLYRSGIPFGSGVVIPAGATNVSLSFKVKQPVVDATHDSLIVSIAPNATPLPVVGTTVGAAWTKLFYNTATVYPAFTNMGPYNLSAYAGTSINIVFTYVSNGAAPIGIPAVDSVAMYYCDSTVGNGSLCASGGTTVLTNPLTAGGVWSSSNGAIASIGTTTGTSVAIIGGATTGTATITYTQGTCQVKRVVTVNTQPGPVTGTFTVCASGGTTTLGGTPASGAWNSGTPANATITAGGLVTGVLAGTSIISYTIGSCKSTAIVTVNAIPSTITGSYNVCAGGGTTVLSSLTPGGAWSSTVPANASISAGTVTGHIVGTTLISYTVSGCATTAAVTVNTQPGAITGLYTVCAGGGTISLASSPASGIWSSDASGNASVNPVSGLVTGNTAGNDIISYTIGSCRSTATITVNALPNVYNVMGTGSFCASGTGADIYLDWSENGINYDLYQGSSPVASLPGINNVLDFGSYATPGTYTIAATDISTNCKSDMAGSAVLTVASPVVPSVSIAPGSLVTCTGSILTLTATPINGGTSPIYEWIVNSASMGFGTAAYSYAPTDGDIVTVILYPGNICTSPLTATTTYTVTVSPPVLPSVSITANPGNPGCIGNPVTFHAVPSSGGTAPTYRWNRNGINVATGPDFVCVPNNGDVMNCVMFSNYACRLVDSVFSSNLSEGMIAGLSSPLVTINAYPGNYIAPGQTDSFHVVVAGAGAATASYQWYVNAMPVMGAVTSGFTTNTLANMDIVTCKVTNADVCARNTLGSMSIHVGIAGIGNVDADHSNLHVFPNPNKGTFTINGSINSLTDDAATLEVSNMLGQVIYSNKVAVMNANVDAQISIAHLAPGMYLLTIRSSGGLSVLHFVAE